MDEVEDDDIGKVEERAEEHEKEENEEKEMVTTTRMGRTKMMRKLYVPMHQCKCHMTFACL